MNHVSITNPDLSKQETTKLTADAVAAAVPVALTVENSQGFSADGLIIIQTEGKEQSEKKKITSVGDINTITVPTLSFNHLINERITNTPYDQVILYWCATEDGTYAAIGSYVDINFDDLVTYIDHDAGTSSTWYKAEFKNSETTKLSGLSAAFQITADVHYCTLNQVLEEAGMTGNRFIAPERVSRLRANAESEVKGSIGSKYELPLSEVPEIVRDATKLLAAGRLLWQEYGTDAVGTVNDGAAKIKEGRWILKDIRSGSILLLDSDDTELSRAGDRAITGWPDNTTKDADADDAGGGIKFRISDKY